MKDVAREAHLALGTVSNYINGKKNVKPQNRVRIEAAIQRLGYEVNEVARNLKLQSSKTIGVILPSFGNVFAVNTVSHLETIFREAGYTLQVCSYNYSTETLDTIIQSFIQKRIDGLIVMPANTIPDAVIQRINTFISNRTPIVIFDSAEEGTNGDHIVLNNYDSIRRATGMLIEMGHTHIALVLGPPDISSSKERLSAYRDTLIEHGIEPDTRYSVHSDYSKRLSQRLCSTVLDDHPEITAVLTAGYRITLGALTAIHRKGLRVPEDISIIGFDAQDISDVFPVGLTTIFIPTHTVAEEIARTVLARFASAPESGPVKRIVELEFIQGGSVARNRRTPPQNTHS